MVVGTDIGSRLVVGCKFKHDQLFVQTQGNTGCSHENPPEHTFCPQCGNRVEINTVYHLRTNLVKYYKHPYSHELEDYNNHWEAFDCEATLGGLGFFPITNDRQRLMYSNEVVPVVLGVNPLDVMYTSRSYDAQKYERGFGRNEINKAASKVIQALDVMGFVAEDVRVFVIPYLSY